jgi:anthranilate synthase component 1
VQAGRREWLPDSVPELEWKETEAKARALLRASELVEEGLE